MGAFSLGKPMWNCLRLIILFSYSKGIDMPHWRKANPPSSEFKIISGRCAIALSVVVLGTVLLLRHVRV